MKRLLQIALIFLSVFYLVSCNADPKGLVSSSDVDKRFEDSATLPVKDNVNITDDQFSFIVISDIHVYHGADSKLVALKDQIIQDIANGTNDKLILACGDVSQCGSSEDFKAFQDVLGQTSLPVYTTLGNHDIYCDGWGNYKEIFGKSCYTFTAGSATSGFVRFVSFDSANGTLGQKQKNWLEWVLKNKTESLVFVFTHFELFSPNTETIQQYTDIEEAYYLIHLFKQTGVDYILMGHSHDYYDKEVNGAHYVNISDFVDKGDYFRFNVNLTNGTVSYQRESL